ncbi:MAG: hypothetical protein M1812_004222 [Candelaria pacifica]|nr:MAG: hypothetical protein M1812_004222 [Candelaria pacifica]
MPFELSKAALSILATKLYKALTGALALNRFPAFCAVLIGGSTVLQVPLRVLFARATRLAQSRGWSVTAKKHDITSKFLAALAAAWLSLNLLNGDEKRRSRERQLTRKDGTHSADLTEEQRVIIDRPSLAANLGIKRVELAGRTLDLTLFAVIRAIDIIVGESWARHRSNRIKAQKWTPVENSISKFTDAGIFALSASIVMWAWFYQPDRLPRAYNRWIGEAAQVDSRLIEVLRQAHYREFVYGKETGQAHILKSMCRDYGWPEVWGDPAKTVPVPCEIVHMGTGSSCEWHAAVRFCRAFKFALATYLPLNLALKARSPSAKALQRAFKDAMRSSAFLGAFVSIFYYSICLSRTRLGPKMFPKTITPQMVDGGLCVGAGCAMCGWSILIEAERRRQEIAFFVAPRAAATLLPRRYDEKYQWRETLAFALSAAIVLTCAQEKPERVRGVFGRVLRQVLH